MYIHRVVIDANCINAYGRTEYMNILESYHDAGLIEILRTQTLIKEDFKLSKGKEKEKAKKYGEKYFIYIFRIKIYYFACCFHLMAMSKNKLNIVAF